eukprot:jgi/Ulvmu1/773/UM010_0147.1
MDRSEEAFGKWAETHGKTYASEEERAKRYKIWQDNVDYIEQQNSKESSYKLALGPHTDLTEEEFKTHGGLNLGST